MSYVAVLFGKVGEVDGIPWGSGYVSSFKLNGRLGVGFFLKFLLLYIYKVGDKML